MIATDEDALICDLAETYQIYDYRQLPPRKVAVFSVGLKDESRIKLLMSGQKIKLEILLMSGIFDKLSLLLWAKTKDGQRGVNLPKSILAQLIDEPSAKSEVVFDSGEDFKKAYEEMLGGVN